MQSRRDFLGGAAAAAMAAALTGARSAQAAPASDGISLAAWSLVRSFRNGKWKLVDLPRICRENLGIGALEFVNQFFENPVLQYLQTVKRAGKQYEVKFVRIMVDGEGEMAAIEKKDRLASARAHRKWVDIAYELGCADIRCNSILSFAQTILGIPFTLYDTFKLENRYGFNTTTPKLWVSDFTKSQVIGVLLLALLTAAAFWLIQWSPSHWWIWVWTFMAVFSLFMMFISPYVIEPLFNKFEPISEDGLEDEIRLLMEKVGLKAGRVMQMDASRRSKHSNAYFTGIGRVKRIVLFDTLIKQMSKDEIIAVLAHEIGHWKLRHILKRIVVVELLMLGGSWLSFEALKWQGLPGLLGMNEASYPAKFIILGFIASLLSFPMTPLSAWLSRKNEHAADNFACEITGKPGALASALTKLSAENLANLHPHPFYARFYYSHPPMVERVRRLMGMSNIKVSANKQ